MKRRAFVKNTSLLAFSIGIFGNIRMNNGEFIGDTITTTDILGPYYRPGAPLRTNLNPPDFRGTPLHLSGFIYKEDGKTVMKNCLIEVWQCNKEGNYDNLTQEYIYRAATKTANDGSYHFITAHPIAYMVDVTKSLYRPPHIHMRISSVNEGYSDLITQIYFQGDPHLKEDPYSSDPSAIKRVLKITKSANQEEIVHFNITMQKEFPLDKTVFKRLSGIYTTSEVFTEFEGLSIGGQIELFKNGDLLFIRVNGQFEEGLRYTGNNSFENGHDLKLKFELAEGGGVKIMGNAFINDVWKPFECSKLFSY